jgi:hypothetical protein
MSSQVHVVKLYFTDKCRNINLISYMLVFFCGEIRKSILLEELNCSNMQEEMQAATTPSGLVGVPH